METRQSLSINTTREGVRGAADALDAFGVGHGVLPEVRWRFLVALDEVLLAIVERTQRDQRGVRSIDVTFTADHGSLTVAIAESAPMFNPLLAATAPTAAPRRSRDMGAAGIALALSLMDEVHYERRDGRNHLLFRGSIGQS